MRRACVSGDVRQYRKGEKTTNKAHLLELTSLLGQLRTSQRSNKRPIFVPEPVSA